jgi:hypothetical protein
VTAAKEGQRACLLEPTDLAGGQINNIPALDFQPENGCKPFNVSGASADTFSVNMPRDFNALLLALPPPNCRTCWVSQYCFLPTTLAAGGLAQLIASAGPSLRIFYETVPVSANVSAAQGGTASQTRRLRAITAVQRRAKAGAPCGGYAERLSASLPQWYTTAETPAFEKETLTFVSDTWVDASYNGELLALSGAPYLQGADERYDGDVSGTGNDTLGQSFTMTYHIHMLAEPAPPPPPYPPMDPGWHPDPFRPSPAIHTPTNMLSWEELWPRRRSFNTAAAAAADGGGGGPTPPLGMDPPPVNNVSAGDVHLAAWPDFYYGYVFASKEEAARRVAAGAWDGGYSLASIEGAERYSHGAYVNYSTHREVPTRWRGHMSLNSSAMGTCTGLAKMPYIRDGRRSIGLDGFIMDINYTKGDGRAAADRVALAGHGFDIWGHRMIPYEELYPAYMKEGGSTGNIYIPLRALTNARVENLLVSGLAMAQSFMINSAVRMHPQEFSNGVGVGAAAAQMASARVRSTGELLRAPGQLAALQQRVRDHAPLQWST